MQKPKSTKNTIKSNSPIKASKTGSFGAGIPPSKGKVKKAAPKKAAKKAVKKAAKKAS
jgi:hypothetical protein